MTRFGLLLLIAPTLAARVELHGSSNSRAFAHLSTEDSLAASNALDILEQLKQDANNEELQEQYRDAIGEIEWEEDRAFLHSGMNHNQEPVMLGEQSVPGTTLSLMEMLRGGSGTAIGGITTAVGRLITSRRDFAVELQGGQTKYQIDGITRSLHSRMQISFPNEPQPRYVVRRAFNYLNPIATTFGQFIYRVIRCQPDSEGGWAGACTEGEMLYTITKDRLGRGTLWGQDEYRVYTGTGGCSRHGHGVLSCSSEFQIMYSLSAGLSDMTHDTNFYSGNIRSIDSGFDSGRLHNGDNLEAEAISNMKVATVAKTEGSPRALNWPIWLSRNTRIAAIGATAHEVYELADSITPAQVDLVVATPFNGLPLMDRLRALWNVPTPGQVDLFASARSFSNIASRAGSCLFWVSWSYHLAKSLIWADAYHVVFNGNGGSTDELLVSVVAAVQDLTREHLALMPAGLPGTSR